MRLFKESNLDGNSSQRTGAGAYATGFALKGETQAFIHMRMPHVYIFENIFPCAFDRLQSACRTGISALHAQNAGLFAWHDVGRSHRGNTFLKAEIFDAIVWANFGTLTAANTAA